MNKIAIIGIAVFLALVISVNAGTTEIILVSDNIADSTAADVLSDKLDSEVVETEWGTFSSEVLEQVKAKSPSKVTIVGGKVAIPPEAELELEALGIEVERLAGKDRYETAALIARKGWGTEGVESAIVVQGNDDSGIVIAKAKARAQILPILYVKKNEVPVQVRERIRELKVKSIEHIPAPDTEEAEIAVKLEEAGVVEINETGRDKEAAAHEAIVAAEKWIERAGENLGNLTADGDSVAAYKLYENAVEHLENAKRAFDSGVYGRAFGQAVSAKALATNSLRISEEVVVGDLIEKVEAAEIRISRVGIEPIKQRLEAKNIKVERVKAEIRVQNQTAIQTSNQSLNNTPPVEPNLGSLT